LRSTRIRQSDARKPGVAPTIEDFQGNISHNAPQKGSVFRTERILTVVTAGTPRVTTPVLHAVSGQALWPHWQAISTSFAPASLHTCPQYLSWDLTMHLQTGCAHFTSSLVIAIVSSFFQLEPSFSYNRRAALFLVKTARLFRPGRSRLFARSSPSE
jgi:hypothetical protein